MVVMEQFVVRKSKLERAHQHLYPLELSCDTIIEKAELNPEAATFRPKRQATEAARQMISAIAADEQGSD